MKNTRKIIISLSLIIFILCPSLSRAEELGGFISGILKSPPTKSRKGIVLKIGKDESYGPVAFPDAKPSLWDLAVEKGSLALSPSSGGIDVNADLEKVIVQAAGGEGYKCEKAFSPEITHVYKLSAQSPYQFLFFEWMSGAAMADLKIVFSSDKQKADAVTCDQE